MNSRAIIHGCLVAIDRVGVLIVGDAGVGKTTVCLELERLGHNFIADDAVLIRRIETDLVGSAPPETAGRVAVRRVQVVKRIPNRSELSCSIDLIAQLASGDTMLPELQLNEILIEIPRKRFDVNSLTAIEIEAFALETGHER